MSYFSFILRHPRRLALGFLLSFFASFGQTYFIALFGDHLRAAFGLSVAGFGGVYALATVASGLTMLYAGSLLDRLPLGLFIGGSVLVLGGAAAGLGGVVTASPVFLFAVLLALRLCGQGLLGHASATTMARDFRENRGKALSFASMGHAAGEAVFPLLAVAMMAWIGWQGTWQAIAALLALVVLPLLLWLTATRRSEGAEYIHDRGGETHAGDFTRSEVLRDPAFYLLVPVVLMPAFINTGVFFHQIPLIEAKGWSRALFAAGFSTYAAFTVIGTLVSGRLVDRFGALSILRYALLPLAAGLMLAALTDRAGAVHVYMALAGISTGVFFTSSTATWAELYGLSHLGAIRAMAMSLMVFATAASPALFGWLIDRGVDMNLILGGSAACCLAGLPLIVAARRMHRGKTTIPV